MAARARSMALTHVVVVEPVISTGVKKVDDVIIAALLDWTYEPSDEPTRSITRLVYTITHGYAQ